MRLRELLSRLVRAIVWTYVILGLAALVLIGIWVFFWSGLARAP
jgi:hypothetical protein